MFTTREKLVIYCIILLVYLFKEKENQLFDSLLATVKQSVYISKGD